MRFTLDSGVLGRQAEAIPPHRVHDVKPLGPLVARQNIAQGVIAHMAHMQLAAGVGEHLEDVIFGLRCVDIRAEHIAFKPLCLPFGFDVGGRILLHERENSGLGYKRKGP